MLTVAAHSSALGPGPPNEASLAHVVAFQPELVQEAAALIFWRSVPMDTPVSYTHLRAHETGAHL
eukprot:1250517-Pyramimonas_sp.AAC.1